MTEKLTMTGYILDQPRTFINIWQNKEEFTQPFSDFLLENNFSNVYLFGGGTSLFDGIIMKYMFNEFLATKSEYVEPARFANHEIINPLKIWDNSKELAIAISITGTSVHSIQALKRAKEEGLKTCVFTVTPDSEICNYADYVFMLMTEQEKVGPETRGYTVIILMAYLAILEAARKLKTISDEAYDRYLKECELFVAGFDTSIDEIEAWYQRIKEELLTMEISTIAGYGINYATAMEARLKLFETYGRPSMHYEMEEMLHGPLRAYGPKNFIFYLAADGPEFARMLQINDYIDQITQHQFIISANELPDNKRNLQFSLKTNKYLESIQFIAALHLLAARLCEDVGIDTADYPLFRYAKQPLAHSHLDHLKDEDDS